jgi:transcriptional regulator with XRE-family HTH domain
VLDGNVVRGRRNLRFLKLASRLKKARKQQGLSRCGLSVAAGLTNQAVSYIENQDRIPRISTVSRLAQVLGLAPGWLAFGLSASIHPGSTEPAVLAERLRLVRAARGLSRTSLAEAAVVLAGSIQRIEEGRGAANVETVERLAIALDVSPAWLAFGDGDPASALVRPILTTAPSS